MMRSGRIVRTISCKQTPKTDAVFHRFFFLGGGLYSTNYVVIRLERRLRRLRCKLPDEIRLEIWRELVIELDHVDIRFVVRSYYRDPKVLC